MPDEAAVSAEALLKMTADVASAYVSNNPLPAAELPGTIGAIGALFRELASGRSALAQPALTPAVPVRRSVMPDRIICLEDGKSFKSIKRHLRTAHSLSPEQYRARWGLPYDYPMVAPNYSAERSKVAKALGLGRQKARRTKRQARRP